MVTMCLGLPYGSLEQGLGSSTVSSAGDGVEEEQVTAVWKMGMVFVSSLRQFPPSTFTVEAARPTAL